MLGKTADSLWQPMAAGTAACFLGGICAFWIGRRLGHGRLEKIRWLHLTPERMKWPEQFFKRHGAKTVFIARFIFLFPPVVVNLLAGMAKMTWRTFLFYNFTGSAACTITYILIGYYFGKEWKWLVARLGSTTLYLILAGLVLIVLGVIYRKALSAFLVRHFSRKHRRQ